MTNTQTLSRRNVLIGASIAAVAAGAPASASIHVGPDLQTLLTLEKELAAALERNDAVSRELDIAGKKADLAAGPRPMHPWDWERYHKPKMPADLKEIHSDVIAETPVRELNSKDFDLRLPKSVREWFARVEAEKEQVQKEWDAWRVRHDEQNRIVGYDEDRISAAYQDCVGIAHRMFEIPANSAEGMAVKVRAAELLGWFNGVEPDEEFIDSLIDDIKRLAAGETGGLQA
ncbi:hypothetical protein AAFN47_18850 [Hoeflea sp. CAU 1731]